MSFRGFAADNCTVLMIRSHSVLAHLVTKIVNQITTYMATVTYQ